MKAFTNKPATGHPFDLERSFSRSISSKRIWLMKKDLLAISPEASLESSHSVTGTVNDTVRSTFFGPLGRPIIPCTTKVLQGNIYLECITLYCHEIHGINGE